MGISSKWYNSGPTTTDEALETTFLEFERRTEIDPDTPFLEDFVQTLDVFDDVMGRVDEEARGNAIPIV